jgi:hypothetical protein
MHPQLDRLVKAFEAYQSAAPEEALRLFALYQSQVEDAASGMKTGKDLLDRSCCQASVLAMRSRSK